jgi:hypothetical protein
MYGLKYIHVGCIACDSADVIAMVADRDACNQDGAIRVGRVH